MFLKGFIPTLESEIHERRTRALLFIFILAQSFGFGAAIIFYDSAVLDLIGVVCVVHALLCAGLVIRNRLAFARLTIPLVVWGGLTISAFSGYGTHDLSVMAFPMLILVTALLLGRYWVMAISVLSFASLVALYWGEKNGLVDEPLIENSPDALLILGVIMGVTAGLLWALLSFMKRDMAIVRQSLEKVERYRLLAENVHDVVWTATMPFELDYITPSVRALTGYTIEELKRISLKDIITKDTLGKVLNAIEEMVSLEDNADANPQRSHVTECKIKCKNGSTKWIENVSTIMRDGEGRATHLLGVTRDVTERNYSEEQLEDQIRFEGLVSKISADFVHSDSSEIDDSITSAIEVLGDLCELDRCYVLLLSEDGDSFSMTHEWCREGVESIQGLSQEIPNGDFSWSLGIFEDDDVLIIKAPPTLPDKALGENRFLRINGTNSFTLVPIRVKGHVLGGLGFSSLAEDWKWPDKLARRLRSVADLCAGAIQRKLAEVELRDSEKNFRQLFEQSHVAMCIFTEDQKTVAVNNAFISTFGYTIDDIPTSEDWWRATCHQEEWRSVAMIAAGRANERDRNRGGQIDAYRLRMMCKDGSEREIELDDNRIGDMILLSLRDVTEEIKADRDRIEYQNQLRTLASELSIAEEAERLRIASYLHDDIGQSLALLKIKLGVFQKHVDSGDALREMESIRGTISEVIDRTRSVTAELAPSALYELGLVSALRQLSDDIEAEHGIQIAFEEDGEPEGLEDDVRNTLYRGMREALVNVVKHAHAKHVSISLETTNGSVRITLEDDGVGFDISRVRARPSKEIGFGLFSLSERLKYVGGEAIIESDPEMGTRVMLKVPITEEFSSIRENANEH